MAGKIYRVIELIEKSTDQASNSLKGSVNTNQGSDLVAVLGGMALSGQNMGTHGGVVIKNKPVKPPKKDEPKELLMKCNKQLSAATEEAESWDGRLEKAGVSRGLRDECVKATEGFIKQLVNQQGELKYFIEAFKACQQ